MVDPRTGADAIQGRPSSEDRSPVEQAIVRSVTEHAAGWFPGVGRRPTVRLRQLVNRPRAVLYAVHLDGNPQPHALAKLRRDSMSGEAGGWTGTRPRLASVPLDTPAMVALEYAGLQAIEAMLDPADPHLSAVRPLAHLVDEDTILMDYVEAGTLRQALLAQSRLPVGQPGRAGRVPQDVWRQVAAWLVRYQRTIPVETLPARQATRAAVVERFAAYDEFLTERLGRRALGDAALRGAELADRALPEHLPLAVGHGDFAPRNVFVLPDGRLAVFDPLPRWAAPRCEDLARFLVGTRLLGLQLHTHGAAFSRESMARREQQLIEGYRGALDVPLAELRCHQLLVTLDHWSALVDTQATGARGRLRAVSARMLSGYLRRETRRAADLMEAAAAGSAPA